jgi:hypothetical protein
MTRTLLVVQLSESGRIRPLAVTLFCVSGASCRGLNSNAAVCKAAFKTHSAKGQNRARSIETALTMPPDELDAYSHFARRVVPPCFKGATR